MWGAYECFSCSLSLTLTHAKYVPVLIPVKYVNWRFVQLKYFSYEENLTKYTEYVNGFNKNNWTSRQTWFSYIFTSNNGLLELSFTISIKTSFVVGTGIFPPDMEPLFCVCYWLLTLHTNLYLRMKQFKFHHHCFSSW